MKAITSNLGGETAECMVALHDEGALELGNVDTFLEEVQSRFGNPTQAHRMESEIPHKAEKSTSS